MTEATKCFRFLRDKIPSWLASLDGIRNRVEERQKEASAGPSAAPPRRKQSNGSTESVRPKDQDGDDQLGYFVTPAMSPLSTHPPHTAQQQHAKLMKRKRKTASVISGQMSGVAKYRTRSMIVVYYDSDLQKAFEDIVRDIGVGRNMLRKGKLAARIEAMANIGDDDDEEDGDDDDDADGINSASAVLAKMGYRPRIGLSPIRSTRTSTWRTAQPAGPGTDECFDTADEALESAQSLCERAAHQSLRDGDCRIEIDAAKESFLKLLSLSEKQLAAPPKGQDEPIKQPDNQPDNQTEEQSQRQPDNQADKQMQKQLAKQPESMPDKMGVTVDIEVDPDESQHAPTPISLAAAG